MEIPATHSDSCAPTLTFQPAPSFRAPHRSADAAMSRGYVPRDLLLCAAETAVLKRPQTSVIIVRRRGARARARRSVPLAKGTETTGRIHKNRSANPAGSRVRLKVSTGATGVPRIYNQLLSG